MAEESVWQGIVNGVHDRWQLGDMSYDEIIGTCTQLERDAMVLAKLNYQVVNGNFEQFVGNYYHTQIWPTIKALRRVREFRMTRELKLLIKKLKFYAECVDMNGCTWKPGHRPRSAAGFGKWYFESKFEDLFHEYFNSLVAEPVTA